jgi:hypothetical protein
MEPTGSSTRRYRAPLVVALVGLAAFAAVGLNAPGALRAVAGSPAASPRPSVSLCISHQEDQWICDGAAPADPIRPLVVRLAAD